MASTFLKLAILTGDDFALLLAAEEVRRSKIDSRPKFNFNEYEDPRFKIDFRFTRPEILRLVDAFNVPEQIRTGKGIVTSGIEGTCILLRRLAYPNRLHDMQHIFGRSPQDLSEIFNEMLEHFYKFNHLITSLDQWWLQIPKLKEYSEVIGQKGSVLPNCFGFIDGTLHRTCRPIRHQREVYSGYKRSHGLKYQSVVTPNGLIANLYGPITGRRHDSYMLTTSRLPEKLSALLGSELLYLYGDSGYPLKRHLLTPWLGSALTPDQRHFNFIMSQMRICVEWEFGELFEQFAFLDFKKNQKILLQPVAKYMIVATILKNCKTCLHGSETSKYFGVTPPRLESYVKNDETLNE